jgi:hypothetical protein
MNINYRFDDFRILSSYTNVKREASKNKYFSFNQSIHAVMAYINRMDPKSIRDITDIDNLLSDNWVSDGYKDKSEEEASFIKGLIIVARYIQSPLDIGRDNIIVNKNLSWQIKKNNTLNCKIDKVFELEDGTLELVDYKSGRIIKHTDNFELDLRTSAYVVLLYENFKFLPSTVSYYYLRPNIKFSRNISEADLHHSYKKIYDHYKFVRETLHLDLRHIPYASY